MENMLQRIEELEMKQSFQDITIDELNQQVIKLNDIIAMQQEQFKLLVTKIQTIEPSNMASQADETPPPHY
ncbi:SlyX family protein [Shewanella surugensis]|uniref:Protein SlyX homolog n=1 Tax=Shewanella surugensis TaxID=212020 RepID=A0ABT0L7E4_9GAMM|nr:SlyX family protein [Shewanella surugensis]MCL1123282.1 SlyX family protein [Shewanella surugensis]